MADENLWPSMLSNDSQLAAEEAILIVGKGGKIQPRIPPVKDTA